MSGLRIVIAPSGFNRHIRDADLVFTAEGSIDTQTTRGKIPAEVGHRAKEYGVPVIALAGTIGKDAHIVHEHGIDAYFSTVPAPCTREHAMEHAAEQIELCAENIMRAILVSMQIGDALRSRRSSSIA